MIMLLRNIGSIAPPINGWDKLPHPNEKSPGANLARIKFYRNTLAHATQFSIGDSEFMDQWTTISYVSVAKYFPYIWTDKIFDYGRTNCQKRYILLYCT